MYIQPASFHATTPLAKSILLSYSTKKQKRTNKISKITSGAILLLLKNYIIYFHIYIKKSLKKITDNHFSFTDIDHRPDVRLII